MLIVLLHVHYQQVYMDGVLDGSVSGSGYKTQITTVNRLTLGTDYIGDSHTCIRATVDELKIYDRALNCQEIRKLYDSYGI